MKNNLNRIIIPKKWTTSLASSKSKEEILRNLKDISSDDINTIWEAILDSEDEELESSISKPDNSETAEVIEEWKSWEWSEERALMTREFFLRLGYSILNKDTLWVAWKPFFILQKWDEIFVAHDFEIMCWKISWVYPLKDTSDDSIKAVIEIGWKPVLVVKIGYEDIIIWGNEKIDAGIFFRDQYERGSYTVQEISEFIKGLSKN